MMRSRTWKTKMIRKLAPLALIALAGVISLTACSGGGVAPKAPAGKTTTLFVMHWPGASTTTGTARKPLFISPSTQSVSIQVNSLIPIVQNAPSPGMPQTTNIVLPAPVGMDSFTVKLYDAQNATGNVVGQVTVNQNIIAGQANTVSATVNGNLAKLVAAFTPASQPFVGNQTTGFTLLGTAPQTIAITPEDADGNAILMPGTVPSVTLTNPSGNFTIIPVSGSPNTFYLVPSSPFPAVTLTAQATDAAGHTATLNFMAAAQPAIYIAMAGTNNLRVYDQFGILNDTTGSFAASAPTAAVYDPAANLPPLQPGLLYVVNGNGTISAYQMQGDHASLPGSFPGLNTPTGIAFDPSRSDLFVTNKGSNTVTVYHGDGTADTLTGTFPNLNQPTAITFDAHNSFFYVTNLGGGTPTVTAYDDQGNQQKLSAMTPFPNLNAPVGIAFDSKNNQLYVLNGNNTVTAYDEQGNQVSLGMGAFPNITSGCGILYDVYVDTLYVSNSANNTVTSYDTAGTQKSFFSGAFGMATPCGAAVVP